MLNIKNLNGIKGKNMKCVLCKAKCEEDDEMCSACQKKYADNRQEKILRKFKENNS